MTRPVSMGTFESAIVESSTPRQRILPSFRECFGEIIRSNPVSLPNTMSLNASCSISEGAIQSVAGKRKSDSLSKHSEDLAGSSENSKRKSIAKKSEDKNKRSYSRDLRSLDLENQPHVGSSHNISNPVGNTRLFRSPFGRISDHMEYFLKAIDLDPENSSAYSCLGSMLPKNGSIRLLNGQVMSTQDLFLKAIDLDPGQGCIYSNLGCELPKNGSIRLLNGQVMSKQSLFLKAIDLDPKNAGAYYNLACMLSRDGSICLLNGQVMSTQDLFLKALEL